MTVISVKDIAGLSSFFTQPFNVNLETPNLFENTLLSWQEFASPF